MKYETLTEVDDQILELIYKSIPAHRFRRVCLGTSVTDGISTYYGRAAVIVCNNTQSEGFISQKFYMICFDTLAEAEEFRTNDALLALLF